MEMGILCYHERGVMVAIDCRQPISREEAQRYVEAKSLVVNVEGANTEVPATFWVPLSAFSPMAGTPAATLSPESFKPKEPENGQGCGDGDCPVHGHSPQAEAARRRGLSLGDLLMGSAPMVSHNVAGR